MRATVIIRSKDEADRLRLTLASLAVQTERAEIVVVDDGSTDHTEQVLKEAGSELALSVVRHPAALGRSSASNAGADKASGNILIFLDGDTLAAPDLVARHLEVHRRKPESVVRGDTWHLRGTRVFRDPEAGTPMPGEEVRVERMTEKERARSRVTCRDIRNNFSAIAERGQPGIYPGAGPRELFEMEMQALRQHPDCEVLWVAAAGSNQSVPRADFLAVGGFHRDISINEHRELALRLVQRGLRMAPASGRSFHMIHRSGWRDPLQDTEWEKIFFSAHPLPEVALLAFLWAGLSDASSVPQGARITSLPGLAEAAAACRGIKELEAIREAHLQNALGKAA